MLPALVFTRRPSITLPLLAPSRRFSFCSSAPPARLHPSHFSVSSHPPCSLLLSSSSPVLHGFPDCRLCRGTPVANIATRQRPRQRGQTRQVRIEDLHHFIQFASPPARPQATYECRRRPGHRPDRRLPHRRRPGPRGHRRGAGNPEQVGPPPGPERDRTSGRGRRQDGKDDGIGDGHFQLLFDPEVGPGHGYGRRSGAVLGWQWLGSGLGLRAWWER